MFRKALMIGMVSLTPLMLSACGDDSKSGGGLFSTSSDDTYLTDLAYTEIQRSNYALAQVYLDAALAVNPNNPYALLSQGVVHQNLGNLVQAQKFYWALIALNPDVKAGSSDDPRISKRRLTDVARLNLKAIEEYVGYPNPNQPWYLTTTSLPVLHRFMVMKRLYDAGSISENEWENRRRANLGALAPLSYEPPSGTLTSPTAMAENIAPTLKSLQSMSDSKRFAWERAKVLDAILPQAPQTRMQPPIQLANLAEVAAAENRLDTLFNANLLRFPEYDREKKALEALREMFQPPQPMAKPMAPAPDMKKEPEKMAEKPKPAEKPMPKKANSGIGVHLASFKSQAAASKGWTTLLRKYSALNGLEPTYSKVNLGAKGTFYRLKAGPVEDMNAAKQLCAALKRRGAFCKPVALSE